MATDGMYRVPIRAMTVADLAPPDGTEALIFDWDGTLVDSTEANYLSLREALGEYGSRFSRDWFDRRTGISTEEMVEVLAAELDLALDPVAVSDRRVAAFLERHVDAIEPVAEVLQVARDAGARGVRLAIATGGHRSTFEAASRRLGLDRLFPVRVTREDVRRGKPAADLFLLALERLGVDADRALVYEDSDEGLAAAAAAGIPAIDVRPLVAPERMPSG